jgi:transcriptional regulator with XRE-family HTH domain
VRRASRFSRVTFGFAVRREREKLGVSQEAFAELADVHRTYISSIERGKVNIGIEVANGIANALSMKLSELIRQAE